MKCYLISLCLLVLMQCSLRGNEAHKRVGAGGEVRIISTRRFLSAHDALATVSLPRSRGPVPRDFVQVELMELTGEVTSSRSATLVKGLADAGLYPERRVLGDGPVAQRQFWTLYLPEEMRVGFVERGATVTLRVRGQSAIRVKYKEKRLEPSIRKLLEMAHRLRRSCIMGMHAKSHECFRELESTKSRWGELMEIGEYGDDGHGVMWRVRLELALSEYHARTGELVRSRRALQAYWELPVRGPVEAYPVPVLRYLRRVNSAAVPSEPRFYPDTPGQSNPVALYSNLVVSRLRVLGVLDEQKRALTQSDMLYEFVLRELLAAPFSERFAVTLEGALLYAPTKSEIAWVKTYVRGYEEWLVESQGSAGIGPERKKELRLVVGEAVSAADRRYEGYMGHIGVSAATKREAKSSSARQMDVGTFDLE